MKHLVIYICGFLCGGPLLAAGPLVPGTFLTRGGIYQGTNAGIVRELTIQTNKLWLSASTGQQSSDTGSYNWVAAHHWFVYVAEDMRIWAYNGERFFILLQADARGACTVPLASLQEAPPAAVLKRLPRAMRNLLPARQLPQPNQDGAANRSQPFRSEPNRTSAAAGSDR